MLWEMLKLQHGHFLSGGKVSKRRREGEEETSRLPYPPFPPYLPNSKFSLSTFYLLLLWTGFISVCVFVLRCVATSQYGPLWTATQGTVNGEQLVVVFSIQEKQLCCFLSTPLCSRNKGERVHTRKTVRHDGGAGFSQAMVSFHTDCDVSQLRHFWLQKWYVLWLLSVYFRCCLRCGQLGVETGYLLALVVSVVVSLTGEAAK